MKKPSWKLRFQYWFDNHMAKGTGNMVWMLSIVTFLVVAILTGAEILFHLREDSGFFSTLWDSLAYTVNAEIPSSEDGTVGYILLTAIGGLVGLLFTSILIGIISSAIEEKLISLRKGNSLVLERDHIVILGFVPGEYALLSQLVLSETGNDACLVIAGNMERDEMERLIREHITVPKGIRIICRNVNICDPNSLQICSIPSCRSVVINAIEDDRTVKALLAVSVILRQKGTDRNIPVISSVFRKEFLLPPYILERDSMVMLQTHDLIARIIAHSCTQPGLSEAFCNIFNFEGSELYLRQIPDTEGMSFLEVTAQVNGAVPVGIFHSGTAFLNPPPSQCLEPGDSLLIFAENQNSAYLTECTDGQDLSFSQREDVSVPISGRVVVIGCSEVLKTILQELPVGVNEVVIADVTEEDRDTIETLYSDTGKGLSVFPGRLSSVEAVEGLVRRADFVVLLSDYTSEPEQADLHSIQLLLKLRDIKQRLGLPFTITAEMRQEGNHHLVATGDPTDFIVASDLISMVLAQLTKTPELYEVFQELLSNEGNELYLKPAAAFDCEDKEYTVRKLRLAALSRGYILLGYLKVQGNGRALRLNPSLEETVVLSPKDSLIVLGTQ